MKETTVFDDILQSPSGKSTTDQHILVIDFRYDKPLFMERLHKKLCDMLSSVPDRILKETVDNMPTITLENITTSQEFAYRLQSMMFHERLAWTPYIRLDNCISHDMGINIQISAYGYYSMIDDGEDGSAPTKHIYTKKLASFKIYLHHNDVDNFTSPCMRMSIRRPTYYDVDLSTDKVADEIPMYLNPEPGVGTVWMKPFGNTGQYTAIFRKVQDHLNNIVKTTHDGMVAGYQDRVTFISYKNIYLGDI